MMYFATCLFLFAWRALAQTKCITLSLPWGNYTGSLSPSNSNVCRYQNIRFGSPPVGNLRFDATQYPPSSKDPAIPQTEDISCVAVDTTKPCIGGVLPSCVSPDPDARQDEDCLFLDIYVPLSAFSTTQKLPVVVWFYGGAYLFGSKTTASFSVLPFYDGEGIIQQSGPVIFVVGNYRLGAFGWLAGTYMEDNAQPNAGLLDQRAILQFVRDHISQLNGNSSSVSVWGESAGASSILHHLVMPLNIETPLFHNALLQSPAYQWLWDRSGTLNDTYTAFASLAGCQNGDISCLQNVPQANLTAANQQLFLDDMACKGIMPVGPSVDGPRNGSLVPDLAVNLINEGKGMHLGSILVSHVGLEVPYPKSLDSESFIPYPIRMNPQDPNAYNDFLEDFASGDIYADTRANIVNEYPASGVYSDQIARAAATIANSSFLCNTRFLIDAYQPTTPTFALDYEFGMKVLGTVYNASTHASDLLPLWRNSGTNYTTLLECLAKLKPVYAKAVNALINQAVAPPMQIYFVNQAVSNKPGTSPFPWSPAGFAPCPNGNGTCVAHVMRTETLQTWINHNTIDPLTSSAFCNFWAAVAKNMTGLEKKSQELAAKGPEAGSRSAKQMPLKKLDLRGF